MPQDLAPVVLDCRWLSIGGPGRATELLLRGLAQGHAPQNWALWGPSSVAGVAWPSARLVPIEQDPRILLGQRHARRIPPASLTVFMHQQRPLTSRPAVTLVHDTIVLRHESRPAVRRAKRLFLRRVAVSSRHIITVSEHSRASIITDLDVPPERVSVVQFPFDDAFADRVMAMRPTLAQEPVALFVGGFRPHKNLARLLIAFGRTRFCRSGGRLVLAGGSRGQVQQLMAGATPEQRRFLTAVPECSQADLDRLFASSRLLVQPSLEEGFGLPAWEALSCGLPLCASDGGALAEVVDGLVEPFPATDVAAMAAAIDECVDRGDAGFADAGAISDRLRQRAPTVRQFAQQFHGIVDRYVP